ncbi:hypothetical protein TCAL_04090, partial [Tigriopus californicus]
IFKNTWKDCRVTLDFNAIEIRDKDNESIGSFELSEVASIMLDGKKHLVLNGWKDQIMTFKKDSMHLELTELQMNSEVRPCRSTSIKSSKSVVVARRISREDYATLSNGSDVLMVPYLSKRKSVSMSTLPRFEVWNEERSNRFSISSTDSKFSTGIRSRTCSKASRSSRMKRPIIPIQSQNLMTLHGRCSHSSENINVVPMEVSTFDKLSVQSAQFVRASRESDLVVTPEASHSAELTFHSNALDFDDTIDVGANNTGPKLKRKGSARIVERVKSLPRNILKLASGKSFDDKQPLKDDKPTIKDEPQ